MKYTSVLSHFVTLVTISVGICPVAGHGMNLISVLSQVRSVVKASKTLWSITKNGAPFFIGVYNVCGTFKPKRVLLVHAIGLGVCGLIAALDTEDTSSPKPFFYAFLKRSTCYWAAYAIADAATIAQGATAVTPTTGVPIPLYMLWLDTYRQHIQNTIASGFVTFKHAAGDTGVKYTFNLLWNLGRTLQGMPQLETFIMKQAKNLGSFLRSQLDNMGPTSSA